MLAMAGFLAMVVVGELGCHPQKSLSDCRPNPALGTVYLDRLSTESPHFAHAGDMEGGTITYSEDFGVKLSVTQRFDNPALESTFYLMYGRVQAQVRVANGTGVVSSFYLQSDVLDEVDLEWFGQNQRETQTNYFSRGNTSAYDRSAFHPIPAAPPDEYHTYTIDWTAERCAWFVDGELVRVLPSTAIQGFPLSPMKLVFGVWVGGDPENDKGTVEWAGGVTDFSQAPFSMFVRNLVVSDYSTGDTYSYLERSGKMEIVAHGGVINGRLAVGAADFRAAEVELVGSAAVVVEALTQTDVNTLKTLMAITQTESYTSDTTSEVTPSPTSAQNNARLLDPPLGAFKYLLFAFRAYAPFSNIIFFIP